ncbi:MAG TPA: response regulator transcription factor [Blastocatellia bacterium]|jgi:two-component system invasion response regulator UvrY|nr:response regulator transcription factor [Blastocatellia bacterium]
MIRILISDENAIVREGLKHIIAQTDDMTVSGEAENGFCLLDKLRQRRFDVLLLDIGLPEKNGLELLKQVKNELPRFPVLVLTMHHDEQYALRALRAGASGYLTEETAPEQVIAAIRKVAIGGRYISPDLAERLAIIAVGDISKARHEILSDREYQVFCMIASGKSPSQIAVELSLSVKTISTHRARLLEKMQMKNNSELTRYALQNRLVD